METTARWHVSSRTVAFRRSCYCCLSSTMIRNYIQLNTLLHKQPRLFVLVCPAPPSKTRPVQDAFIRKMEVISTKRDRTKLRIQEGWYSKEDMSKELKWNPLLDCAVIMLTFLYPVYSEPHATLSNHSLRKKIAGAVQCCLADADNLVRPQSRIFLAWISRV